MPAAPVPRSTAGGRLLEPGSEPRGPTAARRAGTAGAGMLASRRGETGSPGRAPPCSAAGAAGDDGGSETGHLTERGTQPGMRTLTPSPVPPVVSVTAEKPFSAESVTSGSTHT